MRVINKIVVGAFIFSGDNKILLGKSLRGTYEGSWLIPGGAVEDNETFEQALSREISEETGLEVSKFEIKRMEIELFGESEKVLKDSGERVLGKYKFINFVLRTDKNSKEISVVAGDDFSDPKWWDLQDLKNISLPPPSVASFEAFRDSMNALKTEVVKIEKLVHGGQGMGVLADGRKVFVWNSLPDEEVSVEITKTRKDYAEGFAIEVLNPSSDRVATLNRENIELSVSPWTIMSYRAELHYKSKILSEVFAREGMTISDVDIQTKGSLSGYRNKIEFSFWGDADGLHFSHYLRATHQKIKLAYPYIDLIPDQIVVVAEEILRELNSLKIRASDLKSLILRCDAKSPSESKVVSALFVKTKNFPELKVDNLTAVYSNPKSPASVKTKALYINGDITLADTLLGVNITYDVFSFFQVNIPILETVLSRVDHFSSGFPKIDMYSGVGSIGLAVGADVLIESDQSNVDMANKNVGNLPVKVIHAPSETALDYIDEKHCLIVDPPRAGLHKNVVNRILEIEPPLVIYLSCNPSTQARDAGFLLQKYKIKAIEGYNFFPRTPHIESLLILEKK